MSEKKEKKYIIDNPVLMAEWNWEENDKNHLNPQTLTLGSNKKTSWKCRQNHVWEAQIIKRVKGQGCPYCSSHTLLKGFNDLKTKAPHLAKEWNYIKNINLTPSDVFPSSNKTVWWVCEHGHEWEDTPNHRFNRNDGCPYCSGHKIISGINDLTKTHPLLAIEWNYEKNGSLMPNDFSQGSGKKVWWKCVAGHEWEAVISSRTAGNGCPLCKKELQTSFPEQAIFFYMKKCFPDAINRYNESNKELDIFIPSINIGVEYDGFRYHTQETITKEIKKDDYFRNRGIIVIRVKETKNSIENATLKDNIIIYSPSKRYKYLNDAIVLLLNLTSQISGVAIADKVDVSIERDTSLIMQSYLSILKENSILTNETLSNEWNYEKNNGLNPNFVPISSGKKVWWICDKGHEWQAIVASRSNGNNCPYCSNQRILVGYNDLAFLMPKLAKEWHPTKNGDLLPQNISLGTNKKVWWICDKGHEWQANVNTRSKGVGCPYCSNQRVNSGENDLETQNSFLAREWHPTKNGLLMPSMVTAGSGKKVWWICSKGHEWQAYINNRNKGGGCPFCHKESPKKTANTKINVYNAKDLTFYGSFDDARTLCEHFNLDYNKKKSQITSICKRRQRTLLGKFILRYEKDDELKKVLIHESQRVY